MKACSLGAGTYAIVLPPEVEGIMSCRFASVLAVAVLAGCASLEDVRSSEPTASAEFAGEWRAFAECVNFDLDGRVLYDASTQTAIVGNASQGLWFAPKADYEVSVRQAGESTVAVQLRQRATLDAEWARGHYWSAVERCASPQSSSGSR